MIQKYNKSYEVSAKKGEEDIFLWERTQVLLYKCSEMLQNCIKLSPNDKNSSKSIKKQNGCTIKQIIIRIGIRAIIIEL